MTNKATTGMRVGALCVLLAASVAQAKPQHMRVSWCGGDAGDTMCVAWNDTDGGGLQVQWGFGNNLTEQTTATAWAAAAPVGTVYEAEMTGLKPNSDYNYRVGGGGGAWSAVNTFTTGPIQGDPCMPFKFAVMGDGRSQDDSGADPKWHTILAEAMEHDIALVVNTGDLVKDGDVPAQWKNYLETTDPMQASIPILNSMGNHDDDKVDGEGALYNQIFNLPRNSATDTEDFYYQTYGDAIFVALSTTTFKDDGFAQQAEWLDTVFTENPRRWKFVFFHHPNYASFGDVFGFEVGHPPNEAKQNGALVPIFDKHGVDVVFSGHNHWYERFSPMKGGGASDQGKKDPSGTQYVITGGAGAFTLDGIPLGDFDLNLLDLFCGTATGSLNCDGRHHFVTGAIDGNTLSFEVWATSAQNFETAATNIALIDSWEITKDLPLECVQPPGPDPDPQPEPAPMPEAEETGDEGGTGEAEPMDNPEPIDNPEPTDNPTADAGTGEGTNTGAPDAGPATGKDTQPPLSVTGNGTGGNTTGGANSDDEAGKETGGCQSQPAGQPVAWFLTLFALLFLGVRRLVQSRS